jgi:MoxR-like ATPase
LETLQPYDRDDSEYSMTDNTDSTENTETAESARAETSSGQTISSEESSVTVPTTSGTATRVQTLANRMRTEIAKAVVAQDDAIEHLLIALLSAGHVLLEGVPGTGKTLMVLALARTFGGRFTRIQFTPDLMPTDVTGHTLYDAKSGQFQIRKGPAFTNLLLADEINRAPAKTQAALLEVMQEQQISIEGRTFPLALPFMTLATQNPIEQEGTYPLPEAQLDRFLLKVMVSYPEESDEFSLVKSVTSGHVGDRLDVSAVQPVTTPEEVVALQKVVANTLIDERVLEYAVRIARSTRTWQGLRVGVGPRGAVSLVRAARAAAALAGRDFVTPDDVRRIAVPALAHRVMLVPEMEIEGYSAEQSILDILDSVEAPRL